MPIIHDHSLVRIHGLKGKVEHNNKIAYVEGFNKEKGRYKIHPIEEDSNSAKSNDTVITIDAEATSLGLKIDNLSNFPYILSGTNVMSGDPFLPPLKPFLPPEIMPNYALRCFPSISEQNLKDLLEVHHTGGLARDPGSKYLLTDQDKKFLKMYLAQEEQQKMYEALYKKDPEGCTDPVQALDPQLGDRYTYQSMHKMLLRSQLGLEVSEWYEIRKEICELLLSVVENGGEFGKYAGICASLKVKDKEEMKKIIDETEEEIKGQKEHEKDQRNLGNDTNDDDQNDYQKEMKKLRESMPRDVHLYLGYCEPGERLSNREEYYEKYPQYEKFKGRKKSMEDGSGFNGSPDDELCIKWMKKYKNTVLLEKYKEIVGQKSIPNTGKGAETAGASENVNQLKILQKRNRDGENQLMKNSDNDTVTDIQNLGLVSRLNFARRVWGKMESIYLHWASARNEGGEQEIGVRMSVAYARVAYGLHEIVC